MGIIKQLKQIYYSINMRTIIAIGLLAAATTASGLPFEEAAEGRGLLAEDEDHGRELRSLFGGIKKVSDSVRRKICKPENDAKKRAERARDEALNKLDQAEADRDEAFAKVEQLQAKETARLQLSHSKMAYQAKLLAGQCQDRIWDDQHCASEACRLPQSKEEVLLCHFCCL